jgi:hypothetical protein
MRSNIYNQANNVYGNSRPVTPRPLPDRRYSLGSYIVPTYQHESFVRTLSSLMRTRENFSVGHPSQIAPSHARLTWRFFRDRLSKKKTHLIGMDTLLILLSLGPGYHCWGLALKCYELRTRQHKTLMVNVLCPSEHYFPLGYNDSWTKVTKNIPS